MVEVLRRHRKLNREQARARSVELLDMVGIANPGQRVKQYPFEMSGGMRQRVLIAMALACEPELLVADEPTTALDVTIQAQILDLLAELQQRLDVAVLLITHDLGVVAGVCDRVAVMYAGKIVEDATAAELYADPGPSVLGRVAALDAAPRRRARPPRRHRRCAARSAPPPAGCAFAPRCRTRVAQCRRSSRRSSPLDERRPIARWRASRASRCSRPSC